MSWILYRSRSLVAPRSPAAASIWLSARTNNHARGLHGYLHHEGGTFVQYIEGPDDALTVMMDRIRRDGRHRDMRTLACGPQLPGRFRGWDMAMSDAETMAFADSGLGAIQTALPETILAFMVRATRTLPADLLGRDARRG